jgi:hypothetical protein
MSYLLNEELGRMKYLFDYRKGIVISEQTTNSQIKQGPKGDPYQYKKEGGNYFYAKKGTQNWVEQKNEQAIISIEEKIFGGKYTPKEEVPQNTEWFTGTMQTVQGVFDYLASDKLKMNGQGFKTFGYNIVSKGDRVDGVVTNLTKDELIAKATESKALQDFSSYTYPPAPEGGFKAGYVGNFEFTKVNEPEVTGATKTTSETTKESPNQEKIDQWCEENRLLADEQCYPIEGLEYKKARKQAWDTASNDGHPYRRDEVWDENNKILYTIYGSKSRFKRELDQRKKMKNKEEIVFPEDNNQQGYTA